MNFLIFIVAALATYRLSLLFAEESGPGRIFKKLRNIPAPKSATKEGMSCLVVGAFHFVVDNSEQLGIVWS